MGKLTALEVSRKASPGRYGDGDGLWLQVTKAQSKSWLFRYMLHGKAREMGLGSLKKVSLAAARKKASECRELLSGGIDPIERRKAAQAASKLAASKALTFSQCAKAYIEAHRTGWSNRKHAAQWESTLRTYAFPIFGDIPAAAIDTEQILRCIEPIWSAKPETASRVRGRIESVLDWATARGYRQGENPARWRGHIDKLLPRRSKVATVKHHAALPYTEIATFMTKLRAQTSISAKALEFVILTVARTSEAIGATWGEINFRDAEWVVPAKRMKAKKEHRVPLSDAAMDILKTMASVRQNDFIFPGTKPQRPLSSMALLMTLRRMNYGKLTVHGFRSTFRDWAAENTAYSHEVVEMAMAHTISNKAEAAYRRGDLIKKRRRLMCDWANACYGSSINDSSVTPIRAGRSGI